VIPAGPTMSAGELIDEMARRLVNGVEIGPLANIPVFVRFESGDEEPVSGVEVTSDRLVVEVERESMDHDDMIFLSRLQEFVEELAENKRTKAGRTAAALLAEFDEPET